MSSIQKPSHHVCTHSAGPNRSDLHNLLLVERSFYDSSATLVIAIPSQFSLGHHYVFDASKMLRMDLSSVALNSGSDC